MSHRQERPSVGRCQEQGLLWGLSSSQLMKPSGSRTLQKCRSHRSFALAPQPGPTKAGKARSITSSTRRLPSPGNAWENTHSISTRGSRSSQPWGTIRPSTGHRLRISYGTTSNRFPKSSRCASRSRRRSLSLPMRNNPVTGQRPDSRMHGSSMPRCSRTWY